ncbi:MAG: NAD(+)/NADH kinase [Rhodobacteraceae bacterium]|nr:NAD(+)/NADH kinase [Paracoccaceae bacterium]
MSSLAPRVVLVTRQSEYQALLATHGTRGQAEFFLNSRQQKIAAVEAAHNSLAAAVQKAKDAVPLDWSIAQVERNDLDRFLFSSNDIVVAIGQDGLVANLAKYCSGQPVVGVSPGNKGSEGVLTSVQPRDLGGLLARIEQNAANIEHRTMVEARIGSESLFALNELFIGHQTHQSARYVIRDGETKEFQSSSGVIVSTGTGMTGWAKSIMTATNQQFDIAPTDPKAVYFAREPWPSRTSGCDLKSGVIRQSGGLDITSRINDRGVIFADGIEQDFLPFNWGQKTMISIAKKTLNLVVFH